MSNQENPNMNDNNKYLYEKALKLIHFFHKFFIINFK